jgi:polygalacturonase
MKRTLSALAAIVVSAGLSQISTTVAEPTGVGSAASISAVPADPFTPPNFPEPKFDQSKQYNVKDFGAVGDGKANDTQAINKAIEACSNGGGGIVNFPAGTYEVASVHIKSNVCLKLDDKAVITGAASGYDPAEPNPNNKYQDGGHSHFHNSVMWGEDIENFAILGGFVNGGHAIQGDKKSTKKKGSKTDAAAAKTEQAKTENDEVGKDTAEATGDKPAEKPADPTANDFGNKVIAIKNGRNLLFRGTTHETGAHFVYLLNNCENVTIANDVIKKSRDAIDLMGCRNVQVYGCHYTGCVDDTLGVKSDWALGKRILSENIYAWDDYFESGCNGLQFGSETAGDFRNVNCWNIKIGLAMKAGIGITTNDGGIIDGVRYKNIDIKNAANPIYMLITDRLRSGDPDKKVGTIKNVTIQNVTISDMKAGRQGAIHAATISGRPESSIENITLENVKITYRGGEDGKEATTRPVYPKDYSPGAMKARPAWGFYVRNVKGLTFRNVELDEEKSSPKPSLVVTDVDGLTLDHFKTATSQDIETVRLENVKDLTVKDSPPLKDVAGANVDTFKQ